MGTGLPYKITGRGGRGGGGDRGKFELDQTCFVGVAYIYFYLFQDTDSF